MWGSDGTELLPWEEIARTIHTAIFSDWTIHTVIGKSAKNTHSSREEYKEYTQQKGRVNGDFATLKSQQGNFATYMRSLSKKIGPWGNCPSFVGCNRTAVLS